MSNFKYKSFEDFTNEIKGLSENAMEFGNMIVKSKLSDITVASITSRKKDFMRSIFTYLTSYSSYLINLKSHINEINVDLYYDGNVMEFERFKEIIYAKYDYPKILLFTNDLIELLDNSGTKEERIRYLKSDSLMESFGYQSAGQILDDLNGAITMYLHKSTPLDIQNLKILSRLNIGDQRDVRWINDSIDKSLDAIIGNNGTDYSVEKFSNVSVNVMFMGVISLIEYALTLLTLYGAKIMYVSEFAKSFEEDPIEESVKMEDIVENPGKYINVFTSMSDPHMVRASKLRDFRILINDYLKKLDLEPFNVDKLTVGPFSRKISKDNKLASKLKDNLLYKYLNDENEIYDQHANDVSGFVIRIKSLMYTPIFGVISSNNNILNDFITKITKSDDNDMNDISSIKKCSRDTAELLFRILTTIVNMQLLYLDNGGNRELDEHRFATNQFVSNDYTELGSLFDELYRQIASAGIDRFRYLEKKYNDIMHKKDKCALRDLKLTFDTTEEDYAKTSTPYISRIMDKISSVYVDPSSLYENCYSQYLASLPEFRDSIYFKEVSDTPDNEDKRIDSQVSNKVSSTIANLFNKIMSFVKGSIDRLVGFVNSRSVKNAIDWINKNIKTLRNLDIRDDMTMSILPYKDIIAPPLEHIKTKLGSFNQGSFTNQNYPKEFIKSLYPTDTVYNWFNETDPTKKVKADVAYKNFILFNDNGKIYLDEVRPVNINKEEIKKHMARWIDDVVNLGQMAQVYRQYTQDFVNKIQIIKSYLANIKLKDKDDGNTPDPTANINSFISELSKTIQQLWYPVPNIVIGAILTEYKYIQFVYNNRIQTTSEQPQAQQ